VKGQVEAVRVQMRQAGQAADGGLDGLGTAYTPAPGGAESSEELSARSVPESALPSLYVRRGPLTGQRFVLDGAGPMVIGRHSDCGIVLSDVTVSRRHANIRPDLGGFVLSDMGSLNGSYVNRKPVDSMTLADGDELAVGVFRLVFRAGSAAGGQPVN
jgi:hypothetical protein